MKNVIASEAKQSRSISGDCFGRSLPAGQASSLAMTILFIVFLASCTDKNAYKKIDVSGVKTDVKFLRLEQDLFSLTNENYDAKQAEFSAKYGDFVTFFSNEVMGFGHPHSAHDTAMHSQKEDVLGFVNDTIIHSIYDDVENKYS
ncbi:MAG TPA: hypothetical protein VGB95_01470, partial [Chitinophagales bacterium]